MTDGRGSTEDRTAGEVREHYEIERELAALLRGAGSKAERRDLYEQVYRQRSERIPHHPLVSQATDSKARAAAVAPQVALLEHFVDANTRFCEVGAGDGAVARALAPRVAFSLALDVTDALVPSPHAAGNFEFRRFDGFDLGVGRESLDVVYSNDVAEHLHPEDLLDQSRAIRDALCPGGLYVCVTPNRLSGPHDVSRHFATEPEGFHLREYTDNELAATLRAAGFSRIDVVLTAGKRRLSPLLPVGLLRPAERALAALPRRPRRALGRSLAAVKVVARR